MCWESAQAPQMQQSYGQALGAQLHYAPEVYAANAQYSPLYTQLDLSNLTSFLNGRNGQNGFLSEYTNSIMPALTQAQNTANNSIRQNNLNEAQALTPQWIQGERSANPGAASLLDTLTNNTSRDLSYGTELTPAEQTQLNQSVRSGQAARGMGFGPSDVFGESMADTGFGQQLYQERMGAAQGLVAALVAPLLPCAGLSADSLFVDVSLSSGPPPGAATRPNYRAEIGVTIANTGPRPLSLQHVRIAIAFSRRVRDPASGGWAPQPAPAADFLLACWTIEHVDASGEPAGASPCASVADATLTDDAIVLLFAKPLTLCAGCGLRGGGGDALLVVQHRSYLSLDLDAMQPLPVTCAGAPIAGLKPKVRERAAHRGKQ